MKDELFNIKITGDSMSPLFLDEDILTVDPNAYLNVKPSIGDIILFEHPYIKNHPLVKKIIKIEENAYYVQGVNTDYSTDSRHFGAIKFEKILGKILN